ncbi:hypothetical protein [Mameliella alba]|uniref:hypothetical protein n=1 Tax=Mameliella alba TaxID=561184 RepID=UPI0015578086|nr:hypothetical protein [Mameliella alba]
MVSLDGMVRFGSGDAGLDALESQFRACAQALAAAAAEVALNEVSKELGSALSLDELYDALAQGAGRCWMAPGKPWMPRWAGMSPAG